MSGCNWRSAFMQINAKLEFAFNELNALGFERVDVGSAPGDATGDLLDEALLKVVNNLIILIRASNLNR